MGKRLIRIFQKDIPSRINSLINMDINLVLKNNTTIRGVLKKAEHTTFLLEGGRHEIHTVSLDEIVELIYDKESAF